MADLPTDLGGGPMSQAVEVETRPGAITRGRLLRRAAVGGAGLTAGSLLASEGLATGRGDGRGKGLEDRVNRIAQLVCNVSDLERAKAFWEKHTPMRAYAKTETPIQAFRGLGIAQGSSTGYLLRDQWDVGDDLGGGQFALHLVQWKTPAPVGKPYTTLPERGLVPARVQDEGHAGEVRRPRRERGDAVLPAPGQPAAAFARPSRASGSPTPTGSRSRSSGAGRPSPTGSATSRARAPTCSAS